MGGPYLVNGIQLWLFGDNAERTVALDHLDPQIFAAAVEQLHQQLTGEWDIRVMPGWVRLTYGAWTDGELQFGDAGEQPITTVLLGEDY